MTWKEHDFYPLLTEKERTFVDAFCDPKHEGYRNAVLAVRASTFSVKPDLELAFARGLLGRKSIARILDDIFPKEEPLPTREEFLRVVWRRAQDKDSKVSIAALTLYADISGWRKQTAAKPKSAAEEDAPLADLVYQGEHDASGQE